MTEVIEAPAPELIVQERLLVPERPKFRFFSMKVDDAVSESWGSPPDDALLRDIELLGITHPIVVTENEGGTYRIREGRRRFQAAVAKGFDKVPALLVTNAETLGHGIYAVELGGNAFSSENPIMDLDAIESIQVEFGEDDLVEVSRMTCVPLSRVKKIARLRALIGELRDAAREGKMPTPVVWAAASLDNPKQLKLLDPLRANGKLTMADVNAVKKTSVTSHERSLPGMGEAADILKELKHLATRASLEFGDNEINERFTALAELVETKVERSE